MNSTESVRVADGILTIPVNVPATALASGDFLHAALIYVPAGQEMHVSSLDLVCLQTPAPAPKIDMSRPLVTVGLYQGSAVSLSKPPGEPILLAQVEYAGDLAKLQPAYFEPISGPQTLTLSIYNNCASACVVSASSCLKLYT